MEYGFWGTLKKPFFILAPMADVTDAAFRRIILEVGRPDVFYTEFISTDGLMSAGRDRLMKDLLFMPDERPIVAQFFGSKPESFLKVAELARELGFDGIDINMGCPDRKVVKQGSGIGLCKTPELAKEIILATKEGAKGIPVSVKTRLGLNTIDLSWVQAILDTKIPALTIHGTMKEMSKVPAHWDVIADVAKMGHEAGTLVVGNGDIMGYQDGIEKARQSGVDGLMVGRAIFQNPWLFNPNINPESITKEQRLELLLRHTRLFVKFWEDRKSFDLMKKFFKVYVSGWDGAKDLRTALMETKNLEQVEQLLQTKTP
jgi:nifR3 family TIM-barrel protein